MKKRVVCIFTGSRAEYGLLRPLIEKLAKDPAVTLRLIVSGMHMETEFGATYKEIQKDGFHIDEKIKTLTCSDTPQAIAKSIALGITGCADAFKRIRPDITVILGDRSEALGAAIASMICRIPIAHISGGEATFGMIDEAARHSITKMSHLHFVSTEVYRRRVIQLGEEPRRVFNVGALGLDNIRTMELLSKEALENDLGFLFGKKNLLVTFHPVTLDNNAAGLQFQTLLNVLSSLKETRIIFTKANADTGGRIINAMIDRYAARQPDRCIAFASLGQLRYLSMLKYVDAVLGNSSSGIIEAPSFRIGTINIGDRQDGRIRATSVIDCKPVHSEIMTAIKKLYSEPFQAKLMRVVNTYGDGRTSRRIKNVLTHHDLGRLLKKRFYDADFKY